MTRQNAPRVLSRRGYEKHKCPAFTRQNQQQVDPRVHAKRGGAGRALWAEREKGRMGPFSVEWRIRRRLNKFKALTLNSDRAQTRTRDAQ